MSRRVRRVRSWWQETPSAIRWVTYISVPLGFITVGLGVYGDFRQWWEGWSFLTNLVSSFASLLFGVPTALVVLSHLSGMQADAIERRSLRRSVHQAAADFEAAVMAGFKAQGLDAVKQSLRVLLETSHTYWAVLTGPTPDATQVLEAYRERERAFVQHLSITRHRLLLHSMFSASEWTERMSMSWFRLDNDIRPRMADAGLPWLHTRSYLQLKDGIQEVEVLTRHAFDHGQTYTIRHLEEAGASIVPGPEKQELLNEATTTDKYLKHVDDFLRHLRAVRSLAR